MAIDQSLQKLADMPLYESQPFQGDLKAAIVSFLDQQNLHALSVDIFCPVCKAKSTFNASDDEQIEQVSNYQTSAKFLRRLIPFGILHYRCARDIEHYFSMQIILVGDKLVKMGQYPSRASIEQHDFDRFSKILPEERLADIKRASGLASHGIGAGSFVYLRRVFEHLLEQAHTDAVRVGDFDETSYQQSRVLEKIEILRDFLPRILVENKITYSILSKGVHELSEEECIENFGLLLDTIELILDELLAKRERELREAKIKKDLGRLHSKIADA